MGEPRVYREGTAGLVAAIQDLSMARDLADVERVVRRAARRITAADGATLALREGSRCRFAQGDGIGSTLQGHESALGESISGWAIAHRQPVVIPDVRLDRRLKPGSYGPALTTSVVVVPVRSRDPVGAIANYWLGRHVPDPEELGLLQALADSTSVALENAVARAELEARVRERTAALEDLNARLHLEVAERRRAEEEVRQLSLCDELTGLYNRRGFMLLAGRELEVLERTGRRALVLYIDLDGLKLANDTWGHEAGDRLLVRTAQVLHSVARQSDVVGRLGGDEFAVFMSIGFDHPPLHRIVERFLEAARTAGIRLSVGATASVPGRPAVLEDLLTGADQAMYRGRRARRGVTGAEVPARL